MGIGRRSKTAAAAVVLAGLSLGAGACAQRADGDLLVTTGRPADFQATPEYLADAIDSSEGLTHRFEGTIQFSFGGRDLSTDTPLMTGAFDGERTEMRMDLGAMFDSMAEEFGNGEELPGQLLGDDLTMEMVSDQTTLYLRAPFFSTLADAMGSLDDEDLGPGGEAFDVFSSLGDDWAKVDLTAVEDAAPDELGGLFGANQNMDPRAYLEVMAGADAVEDLGSDEIDGEPVTGLAATVSFVEMLEAQGTDPDDLFGVDEVSDLFDDLDFRVELWMDGDANIRRFTLDMSQMMETIAEESDEELPVGGGFDFSMTFDFFDYGDESIQVEFPDDAVDVTEDFVEMIESLPGD